MMMINQVIVVVSTLSMLFSSTFAATCPTGSIRCAGGQHSNEAKFDYYQLALSSASTFCAEHPRNRGSAECQGNYGLVLHGMWPTNADGTWPQACGDKVANDDLVSMLDQSVTGWRDVAPEYADCMAAHEWYCHGTCSGLSQVDYFSAAITNARNIIANNNLPTDQDVNFKINQDGSTWTPGSGGGNGDL